MTTEAMITEVVLPGVVEPDGLQINRRAMPVPGPGQALVEVEATGISFAEQQMRHGLYPGQPKFPFVPGYDLVGTVRAVGPGGDDALVGTRVAAVTKTGGWATHALVDVDAPDPRARGSGPRRGRDRRRQRDHRLADAARRRAT